MSVLSALLMSSVLAGCGAETDLAAAETAIEAANETAMSALAAGDIDTYVSLFTEDAWSMPPNSPLNEGHDAIRAYFGPLTALGDTQFELETIELSVCGPSAVERGAFKLTFTPERDTSPIPAFYDEGHYLVHWVLVDGTWLIRSDAPVSTMTPGAPPPED